MSLRETLDRIRTAVQAFDDEEPEGTPAYDPAHIGGVLVSFLAAAGALYWALWTAFVFEGGLQSKAWAAGRVLFGRATAAQLGYEGPWEKGAFEGWTANLAAAALIALALWALCREWLRAARQVRR
ncbi:MAG: hypothetical protein HY928_01690 [Elusimicrobia bacterium]|nr:hypothetical protein [Elusimicrobiota bacterium]